MVEIPRIFVKYQDQLSPKTFGFLFKLYLEHNVSYQDLKGKIFDNHQDMENSCAELFNHEITTYDRVYNKKKNHYKYILEYLKEKKTFEVIYHIRPRKSESLEEFIENKLEKFSIRARPKLKKLIEGIIIYNSNNNYETKIRNIHELILPFFDIKDLIICKTCDISNSKHYGKKPTQYIHAILNSLLNAKNPMLDIKTRSLEKYKQQQEENERILGIEIASGKIDDNSAYKAMLQCKDFKELNRIYKIGYKILKEENKETKTYDWLDK